MEGWELCRFEKARRGVFETGNVELLTHLRGIYAPGLCCLCWLLLDAVAPILLQFACSPVTPVPSPRPMQKSVARWIFLFLFAVVPARLFAQSTDTVSVILIDGDMREDWPSDGVVAFHRENTTGPLTVNLSDRRDGACRGRLHGAGGQLDYHPGWRPRGVAGIRAHRSNADPGEQDHRSDRVAGTGIRPLSD